MSEKRTIPMWKSILSGALLGAPTAMCGAAIPLSFRFADSQFFMLLYFFPVWGLVLGLIVGFAARKPSKKHPDRTWGKRLLFGAAIIFALSILIGIPMVI